MERKWTENEEIEREWGNEERFTLYISSLSIHFLDQKLSHLVAKFQIGHFCRECHKKHTRYEKIILGRIRCEKAPQVVTKKAWMINACTTEQWFGDDFSRSKTLTIMMLSPIWLQLFCKSPWGSSTAGQFFFCSHDRTIIWKPMFSFKRGGPLCREYKLLPCFRFRLKGETSWQTFPHNVFHTTIHSSYRI